MVSLRGELAQARAELGPARERIAELEARLAQTPRNSSKPPSSEGLAKPSPRSLRTKSGRRPGGQDGHKGTTLAQVARPDREVRHEPGCCGRCGAALAGRPVTGVERRCPETPHGGPMTVAGDTDVDSPVHHGGAESAKARAPGATSSPQGAGGGVLGGGVLGGGVLGGGVLGGRDRLAGWDLGWP